MIQSDSSNAAAGSAGQHSAESFGALCQLLSCTCGPVSGDVHILKTLFSYYLSDCLDVWSVLNLPSSLLVDMPVWFTCVFI